jgi:multidrug efflux pump subunit AcrA (membrane-fusion protein)
VKALESRSQLLDAALASADEANRRWEECRALVDQLRIENTALRAALSQTQMLGSGGTAGPPGGSDENRSAPTRGTDVTKGAEEPKE